MNAPALGWTAIVRLGLVQSSLGAIVMLTTSMLNRVMVVELALPAMLPAGLVAWHYAVQLSRPRWGHGSDIGNARTPWIIGGMGVLAMGGLLATNAVVLMAASPAAGIALGVLAFTMIGAGVGASGTSLLALLATHVAPARRPAAAAIAWIMMIAGIVVTAGIAGVLLDPFSPARLANVAGGLALGAFVVTLFAVRGIECTVMAGPPPAIAASTVPGFWVALRETLADARARLFTLFVFVSMLAYSAQDMILEPFAGLVFDYTPGQSTHLSSLQHLGVLAGMVLAGVGGSAFHRGTHAAMRRWIIGGCAGSAGALMLLVLAASGQGLPLRPTVFLLGLANGIFAVSAIAAMMDLAGDGKAAREGIRMGVWGAAQAVAFGTGGFAGAAGLDAGRAMLGSTPAAFQFVFAAEALLFVAAALIAMRLCSGAAVAAPATGFCNVAAEVP